MGAGLDSPQPRDALSQFSLAAVVGRCQEERGHFRRTGQDDSPACLEIFRRAFGQDEDAWEAAYSGFSGDMRRWLGAQSRVDPEDVIQDAWLGFSQGAPKHANLVAGTSLAPLLAFLRRCVLNCVAMQLRGRRGSIVMLPLLETDSVDDGLAEAVALRLAIRERLRTYNLSDIERLILELRFSCGLAPREIADLHPEHFPDVRDVYTVVRRLTRRLLADPALREIAGNDDSDLTVGARQKSKSPASLAMETLDTPDGSVSVNLACHLDEAQLLDYITGLAAPELRRAVEASPACVLAAEQLQAAIGPLLPLLHRLICPESEQLVAYLLGEVQGTEQLVVRRHVADCPHCRADLEVLAAIAEAPLREEPGPLRRLIAAVFQSPLAQPQAMRGGALSYATDALVIHLSTRQVSDADGGWILRGQLRDPQGMALADGVEWIALEPEGEGAPAALETTLDSTGVFAFQPIDPGRYRLRVVLGDADILTPPFAVGDDD